MNSVLTLVAHRLRFVTIGSVFLGIFLISSNSIASEKLFSLKIGPSWPSAISTSWDGELLYGSLIDKKVGFGIAADFLWNTNPVEKDSAGLKRTVRNESHYMFPVMGFLAFDPIPAAMIHPLLKFEIGYNSLVYSRTPDSTIAASGYYYGLIIKIGIDGLYNLGEQTAIFAGLDYQWADTRNMANASGYFYRRDMSGMGLRMGFRFLL